MMVFLFGGPLLNPVIIGLFVITFGWQVAVLLLSHAMTVSVVAGYATWEAWFERYVKPEAYESTGSASSCGTSCGDSAPKKAAPAKVESSCGTSACGEPAPAVMAKKHLAVIRKRRATSDRFMLFSGWRKRNSWNRKKEEPSRWMRIWFSAWKDFKQVFPYLMMGIAIGSFIYGFHSYRPNCTVCWRRYVVCDSSSSRDWYPIVHSCWSGNPIKLRLWVQKGMALGSVMAWSLVVRGKFDQSYPA